ncbi:MAG: Sensor protein QseC [Candidatus Accumulibacter adjunctus]|uniref:histidine kinase n=1 Tax=Candidatus Accumulibacter adjunctus TaxID=1454001 RepID=A0A011M4D7_9PROT|nr:MAG: Sensor protein QseC [Candidatus Accumulibacter adjunctus]
MKSIRRQLLLALLAVITLAILAGALAAYRTARDEASALLDYQLRQLALSFRDEARHGALRWKPGSDDAEEFSVQIWAADGTRIYLSHPLQDLPHQVPLGHVTVDTGSGKWRVFGLQQGGQVIQVAQPMQLRDRLALAAALRIVAPFLLLLPVLAVLIWVVIGRGLRPLVDVAQAVGTRTAIALDPLPDRQVPAEVVPLVVALNELLLRLQRALEQQREFVADAAHELRTPLAALTLQVQLAERAADAAARDEAFGELKGGLQRATHSVQQLLTLARLEPGAGESTLQPVDLRQLAAEVIVDHLLLAEARQIDLGAPPQQQSCFVAGDADALRILLANLISNALRFTPRGGRVDVVTGSSEGLPFVEVCDSGEGIPPAERERVFDRFYRRAAAGEAGSGLGLAIVRAIAERHRARVLLADAKLGGLRARVEFPRLAPP